MKEANMYRRSVCQPNPPVGFRRRCEYCPFSFEARLRRWAKSSKGCSECSTLFEKLDEQFVYDLLHVIISEALGGDKAAQKDLVEIFEDDWKTVKERIQIEGSDWIVWWMDGAGNLMRKIASGEWSVEKEDC